jgi:hypothetical protein
MARPHIEFIQSQVLPWDDGVYGGGWPGVETRILSKDGADGDASLLVRYPAGWSRPGTEHLLADEELFVLDGAIEISGTVYGRHCYAHLPAGYLRTDAKTEGGAVVLTFYSTNPEVRTGIPQPGLYDKALLVHRLSTLEMPWDDRPFDRPLDPNIGSRPSNKTLWHDPRTGEWTFLVAAMAQSFPDGYAGMVETHPVVEEMYLLSGELIGNTGIMQPGAYFWRPPYIEHGPYGTLTGWMGFFRGKGGEMENIWTDHKVPFTFTPAYNPALPPELADLAPRATPGTRCY